VHPDLRIDLATSLSAGTPVVRARRLGDELWQGAYVAGVVWLRERGWYATDGSRTAPHVLAHELVHVVQDDGRFIVWAEPVERRIWAAVPGGAVVGRYVDVGLHIPAHAGLNALLDYDSRPWEREANLLSGTRRSDR
jgi:hypothetical protein